MAHDSVLKAPGADSADLRELTRRLVAIYAPERIYLFGSVARGDADPDSDYDVMVVVADDAPPERRRSQLAYDALWGSGIAADVWCGPPASLTAVRTWRLRCPPRFSVKGSCCMPHDPELVGETRSWLTKAASDLEAATHDLRADPPLLEDILFHAQQAVEKTLKGFLTWHCIVFRKTHNLVELGGMCSDIVPEMEGLLRRAADRIRLEIPLPRRSRETRLRGGHASAGHRQRSLRANQWKIATRCADCGAKLKRRSRT